MISKTTKRFCQMLVKLPNDVRRQAREAYRLFRQNPNHPSLRFKKVHATEPIYSARINIDYRVEGFSGVMEMRSNYATDTYRAVYATKIGDKIYVLHCFQKKSKRGISTPKKSI